jgi:formate hydrogenlyase transcriptional activator
MGRQVEPLTGHDQQLLRRYDWPGNVRELQNVIERALILSTSPRLDLAGAMPTAAATNVAAEVAQSAPGDAPVLTAEQMLQFERDNFCRAMTASNWKIAGPDGAAARLGLKPSTLTSRLKALNITRPRG